MGLEATLVWMMLAHGAVLAVGPNGEYLTIEEAVAAASDDDTLLLEAGHVFDERVRLSKPLTIEGEDLSATWTCSGSEEVVCLEADAPLTLRGFSLVPDAESTGLVAHGSLVLSSMHVARGTYATDYHPHMVLIDGASTVQVEDCAFVGLDNTGGGIDMAFGATSAVTVRDSVFSGFNGIPLSLAYATEALIERVTILNSTFGLWTSPDGDLEVREFTAHDVQDRALNLTSRGEFDSVLSGSEWFVVGGQAGRTLIEAAAYNAEIEKVRVHASAGQGFVLDYCNDCVVEAVEVQGGRALHGAGMKVAGTDVTLRDLVLTDNVATGDGGALHLGTNSFITVERGWMTGNSANRGGAIMGAGPFLNLSGSRFVVRDSYLGDNHAELAGGAVFVGPEGEAGLHGLHAAGNDAVSFGGAVRVVDGQLTADDCLLAGNDSPFGGGLSTVRSTTDLMNCAWVGNTGVDGAALAGEDSVLSLTSSVFDSNDAFVGSYLALLRDDATVENVAFVANDGRVLLGGSTLAFDYSWIDDPSQFDAGFAAAAGPGLLTEGTASFVMHAPDGDPSNDDLHLLAGSQLVDAGNPTLLDADGSRSDIGLFGGAQGASLAGYSDGDGDGVAAHWDCDDTDPTRFPGAAESCNWLDDNCNGEVDEGVMITLWQDLDHDGFGAGKTLELCEARPGLVPNADDADDTDPMVGPAESSSPTEPVDTGDTPVPSTTPDDTEDPDDTEVMASGSSEKSGCGCSVGPTAPMAMLWSVLARR